MSVLVDFPTMSGGPALSSCRPLIALLDENDHALKQFALEKLVCLCLQKIQRSRSLYDELLFRIPSLIFIGQK